MFLKILQNLQENTCAGFSFLMNFYLNSCYLLPEVKLLLYSLKEDCTFLAIMRVAVIAAVIGMVASILAKWHLKGFYDEKSKVPSFINMFIIVLLFLLLSLLLISLR